MSIRTPPDYDLFEQIPDYSESVPSSEIVIDAGGPSPLYSLYPIHTQQSHDDGFPNDFSNDTVISAAVGTSSSASLRSDFSRSESLNDRFVYLLGNIQLDLGPRTNNLGTPSYGRSSNIRGEVTVKNMNHVKAIVVKLEGRTHTSGLVGSRSVLKILDVSQTLFTMSNEDGSNKAKMKGPSKVLPFNLEFPSTVAGGLDPLPPTFRSVFTTTEGWVNYKLQIDVVKTGLWPREVLPVTINYLPKFYLQTEALLWPQISLMDAKRFGCPQDRWRTSQIHLSADTQLTSSKSFHSTGLFSSSAPTKTLPEVFISIPSTAKAIAATCFPVNVTIRVPEASDTLLDLYVKTTTVQLIKRIKLTINGAKSTHDLILGNARVKQVEKELVAGDTRIIRASAVAGTLKGEASWKVGDIIAVEYLI